MLALLLGSLPLAACQPADALSGALPTAASWPIPATLTGEYRVAAIDGQEVGGGIGIALTVTDSMIWFDPRCAGFSWTYAYSGGALTMERPERSRFEGGPYVASRMRPTCRIAVHPEQQRLAAALDAAARAQKVPSNGIELSGGGHSVTLYAQ
ncbi:hypothetical protein ACM64M_02320 [Qipengyuania sp. ASV99]